MPTPAWTDLRPLFVLPLLLLGVLAFDGAWLAAAASTNGHAGWMAPFAALIGFAPLWLARAAPGSMRALLALLATATALALGNWLVAALPIGQAMGQFPLEAARRIGPDFGWMLIRLGNRPSDCLWTAFALVLAGLFGRGDAAGRLNGRRRAP